jgi:putative oligomerization/nucleic acid binding protein
VYNPLGEARKSADEGRDKDAVRLLGQAVKTFDIDELNAAVDLAELLRTRNQGRTQRRAEDAIRTAEWQRQAIANASFEVRATINFQGLDNATVGVEQGVALPAVRVRREAETLLFALYAARQMANLGSGEDVSESLGHALTVAGTPAGLDHLMEIGPGDVRVTFSSVGYLRQGFRAELRHPAEISRFGSMPDLLKRISFKMDVKGFPPSGQGINYFAPTSALVLLYVLARRRSKDAEFLARLGFACSVIGVQGAEGDITVVNQVLPAVAATVQAWTSDEPPSLMSDVEVGSGVDDSPMGQLLPQDDPALRIARERYARGEISRDEFKEIQADLLGS